MAADLLRWRNLIDAPASKAGNSLLSLMGSKPTELFVGENPVRSVCCLFINCFSKSKSQAFYYLPDITAS